MKLLLLKSVGMPVSVALLGVVGSVLCGGAWSGARAQNRQPKAEPGKLVFKRGSFSSVPISDAISGDTEAEYGFDARKKQTVTIHLTAQPKGSVVPKVVAPSDDYSKRQKLQKKSDTHWTFVAPETGDYVFSVLRNAKSPGKSRFTVVVTIR